MAKTNNTKPEIDYESNLVPSLDKYNEGNPTPLKVAMSKLEADVRFVETKNRKPSIDGREI